MAKGLSEDPVEKAKLLLSLERLQPPSEGQSLLLALCTMDTPTCPHVTLIEKDLAHCTTPSSSPFKPKVPLFDGEFGLRPKPDWMIINCASDKARTASEAGLAPNNNQKRERLLASAEKLLADPKDERTETRPAKRTVNTATIYEMKPITGRRKGRRGRKGEEEEEEEVSKSSEVVFAKASTVQPKKRNENDEKDKEEEKSMDSKPAPPSSEQEPTDGKGGKKRFVPPFADAEKRTECASERPAPPPSRRTEGKKEDKQEHNATKNLHKNLVEQIESEILDRSPAVLWDDIVGLEHAKKTIEEILVLPMLLPELRKIIDFPKGLLLFGPPGTGKTMIAKAVATQCKSTFFNISPSILTSKWMGEGEKLVRTLFEVAKEREPSIIFIDEIDSLLCSRTETDYESSRRLKTEFLSRMDGVTSSTNSEERVIVIGATNRPHDLDEAIRRRLAKRLYIPLPNKLGRLDFLRKALSASKIGHTLTSEDIGKLGDATKGMSGADLKALVTEASMARIRSIPDMKNFSIDMIRKISMEDFTLSLNLVKATVSRDDLGKYLEWNNQFGSYPFSEEELDT